jgi:hypothetical protein
MLNPEPSGAKYACSEGGRKKGIQGILWKAWGCESGDFVVLRDVAFSE